MDAVIERDFDVAFVARQAFREKQIQQNYRPIIGVHKWFARRPGSLFRALLRAEFEQGDLSTSFFRSHDLRGIRVADRFMGGGTPLLEANRLGCDVIGYDINPMAYWIVRQEIEAVDLQEYGRAVSDLLDQLESQIGRLYRTTCTICGGKEAQVKYFIWVKTHKCQACDTEVSLFPGYLLAENRRHPRNVLICSRCGELVEAEDLGNPGACPTCGHQLQVEGDVGGSRFVCPHCGRENRYLPRVDGPPTHRMVAIEYYCPRCRGNHHGRFFKKPDARDLAGYEDAANMLGGLDLEYVPNEEIPSGDETDRLLKWGYRRYRELFNDRQLLGLELSARAINLTPDPRIRNALATNLSDLLRYQNLLCRYDTIALKSLDVFSIHGFPVSLVQCESNLIGIAGAGRGIANVGSGGWSNITEKYRRAKEYCLSPFEVFWNNGRKTVVRTHDEWIGDRKGSKRSRAVDLQCGSSTAVSINPGTLDIVVTDPPYFSNVQYAELMDFCYVWLKRLVADQHPAFSAPTTRNPEELTGNATEERGLVGFASGLSTVFCRMAEGLKSGSALVFTYHHNNLDAYHPVVMAVLDAGLTCTRCLPCPAEMGASIHINGTGSSIVDSVFVCRRVSEPLVGPGTFGNADIVSSVADDVRDLRKGDVAVSPGDVRCISYGHLTARAIRLLRNDWDPNRPVSERLGRVKRVLQGFDSPSETEVLCNEALVLADSLTGGTADCRPVRNTLLK